jgi:GNAT superfamily N-acetyltransferase
MDKVSQVLGRDLSREELSLINRFRHKEFNSTNKIVPASDNDDWQKPYFLLKHDGEVVAFGRLHSVDVEFRGVGYEILGIASVIAIMKGRGYGRKLMGAMKAYIENSGKAAIGFCDPKVSEFYEKSGYSIIRQGMSRFIFVNDGKRIDPSHPGGDVLYLSGRDQLMLEILTYPKESITAFKYAW